MILFNFKEYLRETFGINARYKGYIMEGQSSNKKYQEQNTIIIFPQTISMTYNEVMGTKVNELNGYLSIFITEERIKEEFIFNKILMNQKDNERAMFHLNSDFSIRHWNEELMEVSVDFTFLEAVEFNRVEEKVPLDYDYKFIIKEKK